MSASDVGGRPRRPVEARKEAAKKRPAEAAPAPRKRPAQPSAERQERPAGTSRPAQPRKPSAEGPAQRREGTSASPPGGRQCPAPAGATGKAPAGPRSPSDAGRPQRRRPGIPVTSPTARPTRSGKPSGPQISKPSFLLKILYSSGMKRSATARTALRRIPILPSSARSSRAADAERRRRKQNVFNTPAVIYTQPASFNRDRLIVQLITVLAVVAAFMIGLSVFFKVRGYYGFRCHGVPAPIPFRRLPALRRGTIC